jgi:hypothetical protein
LGVIQVQENQIMKLYYTIDPPSRRGMIVPYNEIRDGEIYTFTYSGLNSTCTWQRIGNDEYSIPSRRVVGPDSFIERCDDDDEFLIIE